ncbi:putative sulfate exporter family transporter [Agromyces cerinus subsp. nitratus]|uniref:putative sulfate exporter family transporter n=1 Tax=Agromyces cerinus TaxID=33878 RepID=UPI003625F36D
MPLFVAGFLAAVLLNTFVPLPEWLLSGADTLQTALLAMALSHSRLAIRLGELASTGWRALVVGLTSWVLVAGLAYGAVLLG